MVFEYMLHGDLAELLRKADPSIRGTEPPVPLKKVSFPLSATTLPLRVGGNVVKRMGRGSIYF